MSPPQPPPPGAPEDVWCKNRLQQFTQRASIPLPEYTTTNEGSQHAPQFRSQVLVDGTCFISPNTFSNKKMAEQDAAKHALIGIQEKIKNEGSSRILEDTVFCKSIINEYVVKLNLNPPTYVTNESKAMLPVFVSSIVLNGVSYVGAPAKSKKEAEQLAARSAILSILESESSTTVSEIVKSKFKFYDALKNVKDSPSVQGDTLPVGLKPLEDFKDSSSVQSGNVHAGIKPMESSVQGGSLPAGVKPLENFKDSSSVQSGNVHTGMKLLGDSGALSSVNKRKEVDVSGGPVTVNSASVPLFSLLTSFPVIQVGLPESNLGQFSSTQATGQAFHEFKMPKMQTPAVAMPPPIVFVPPASEQPLICLTSEKKLKHNDR